MGTYGTAQICLNGHEITTSADSSPELTEKFCSKCGAATITKCPSCNAPIRGYYHVEGVLSLGRKYKVPSYCHNCGKPYPWTQSALEATQELLSLEPNLSENDLTYLSENMASVLSDTPKTKVVATKLKIALTKVSSTTASAVRDILVDIASEAAKKIIFPT